MEVGKTGLARREWACSHPWILTLTPQRVLSVSHSQDSCHAA
jgi:hypothetical protein